jgi:hypothetical protein
MNVTMSRLYLSCKCGVLSILFENQSGTISLHSLGQEGGPPYWTSGVGH